MMREAGKWRNSGSKSKDNLENIYVHRYYLTKCEQCISQTAQYNTV